MKDGGSWKERVTVECGVQGKQEGGGTKGEKRIVTLLCCSRNVVILCHMYHQPDNLQLMDVCSGWCDHAGR